MSASSWMRAPPSCRDRIRLVPEPDPGRRPEEEQGACRRGTRPGASAPPDAGAPTCGAGGAGAGAPRQCHAAMLDARV